MIAPFIFDTHKFASQHLGVPPTTSLQPDDLYDAIKTAANNKVTKKSIKAYLHANQFLRFQWSSMGILEGPGFFPGK